MPEEIVHALTHALTDSLKLLPFLFLVYFFIELTEEKLSASHKHCWAVFPNADFR